MRIVLTRDGKEVAAGSIDPKQAGDVFVLEARDVQATGSHAWKVSAAPAVPGLAFSLTTTTYGPWPEIAKERGLELKVGAPEKPSVGKPASIAVQALVPAGAFTIKLALPAGVVPDTTALEALVTQKILTRFETADGELTLHARVTRAGKAFSAQIRVIPTLAGSLHTGPTALNLRGRDELFIRPSVWTVAR